MLNNNQSATERTEVMSQEEEIKQVEQQIEPGQGTATQEVPTEDLLSRVSKFVANSAPKEDPKFENIEGQFDIKEIDSITDPVAKEQALKAYKSFQRGFGEKFQELSQLRKEMEALKSQGINQQQVWTPERVQQLANDPQFIEAARQVAEAPEEGSDEFSALSESEQAKIKALNEKVAKLEAMNNQALQQQQQALRQQHHQSLQSKYSNYDPKEIDTITYDMLEGKIQATPEHIYKAFKHDDNVRNAYELGRLDERNGINEKIPSASIEGIQTNASSTISPEDGESSKAFFNRIISKNLSKFSRK